MFVPGVIIDPAFTHLLMSVAFAAFTFAEYIRYFALWPLGKFIHLFLNDFLDSKDSGSAILSHFYLLTGIANGLWLEGPWRIIELSGLLTLGIGDAMASIAGKRFGRLRWTSLNPKTVEGTAAFFISVFACAVLLRSAGFVEQFSLGRYSASLAATCLLEAFSNQNDNLTIPIYLWSTLVLTDPVP